MGVAHMLGVEGAVEPLSRSGPRFPLLGDEDVFLFSYGPEQATEHERRDIESRGLNGILMGEVAADPEGAAVRALALMEARCDRLLVHFDVDTVDFTDPAALGQHGAQREACFRRGSAGARDASR